ncbi:SH3 domain-containing protein [Streptomyces sp. NPDC007901]|uniref:SH3 domain-containing protein n=1 Tax=Streptomyces sp. NPDC007901 TaxID=3364785 RepID=UPI0036ECDF2C
MSPRRPLARAVATAAATAALVALCATAPAHADDDWNTGDPGNGSYDDSGRPNGIGNSGDQNNPNNPNNQNNQSDPNHPSNPNDPNSPGRVVGVVTAQNGIWLLDRPDRGSGRVRFVRRGTEVFITCRTIGESVYGDRVWYRVADGTWAWGPAHYIDTAGDTPRWC